MVFMAQMEKVLSDLEKSSSSSDEIIAEQISSLKPYVPNVILEKIIIDLEDEVVSLLDKEKENLKTIESLITKGFESSENANSDLENQSENDGHVVGNVYDDLENPNVGITQQFSAARTPQQNSVMERRNRTLVEAARTMLTFANLPSFLWAEAIATACFTQNRLIIHKRFDKTPYELMNKRKPNIKFFRVFGFSQVDEASKKDLEYLFEDFYDEYFDSSNIMKSLTMNVETSINQEVFHEVSESFQGESSSSSLNMMCNKIQKK
nr:retrovirus-related Pol polyprotein from transposon TNT 1-94 [Tanacetum cinerariifolium]